MSNQDRESPFESTPRGTVLGGEVYAIEGGLDGKVMELLQAPINACLVILSLRVYRYVVKINCCQLGFRDFF